jgi:hypothetical protein
VDAVVCSADPALLGLLRVDHSARRRSLEALQEFVDNFTYLGIFAVLLLGSLGVPIPEEMPIIAGAVLSHEGIVRWWLALPVCLLGVLSGESVVNINALRRAVTLLVASVTLK